LLILDLVGVVAAIAVAAATVALAAATVAAVAAWQPFAQIGALDL
jgi:hypothetical protein